MWSIFYKLLSLIVTIHTTNYKLQDNVDMKQSMRVSRAISVLFTVVVPEYSHFCIITYSKNQFRIKLFRTNRTNSE